MLYLIRLLFLYFDYHHKDNIYLSIIIDVFIGLGVNLMGLCGICLVILVRLRLTLSMLYVRTFLLLFYDYNGIVLLFIYYIKLSMIVIARVSWLNLGYEGTGSWLAFVG